MCLTITMNGWGYIGWGGGGGILIVTLGVGPGPFVLHQGITAKFAAGGGYRNIYEYGGGTQNKSPPSVSLHDMPCSFILT